MIQLSRVTSKILGQVESYALAVAQDPRFLKEKTRWRFMVISTSMDEHAKRKASQRERRKGLVFDDADLNIQVWAFDWTEVIANARARLQFVNEALSYEASRERARGYLEKAHAKFIPEAEESDQDQPDSSEHDQETATE